MKYNLLFWVMLITTLLPGQSRFSLEAFGVIGVSQSPNSFLKEQGIEQNAALVGRAGFGGSIPVFGNFLFRTGIQLTEYGSEIGGLQITDVNGQPIESGVKVKAIDRTAEIFLLVRYELPTYRRFVPYAEGGLILNKYIDTRRVFNNDESFADLDEDPFQKSAAREFNTVVRIGAGINFLISPKFGLFYGMGFQQYLTSSVEDVPAKIYPWRFDAEVGVRFFPGG